MCFPVIHAVQKERREQQGTALCIRRRTHNYTCPSIFPTMHLVKHSRDYTYSIGIYASCPNFSVKKVNTLSIHECFMWSIGAFCGAGNPKIMIIKADPARCQVNPCHSRACCFSCKTLCTYGGPAPEKTQCLEWDRRAGRIRVVLEKALIPFELSTWLLKFHLKALNPCKK